MARTHRRPLAPGGKLVNAGLVDMETGEALGSFQAILVQPKRRYLREDYCLVFLEAFGDLAEDPELGEQALRVLIHLVKHLGMRNEWKTLNQREIGERLGMKQPNVSVAMKLLERKGIIVKGARMGRGHVYSMSPTLAWRGPAKEHPAALKSASPLRLIKGGKAEPEQEPESPEEAAAMFERKAAVKRESDLKAIGAPTLFE